MTTAISPAMIRELRSIETRGEPTDPYDWHHAGSLWFHAREKVLGALLRRGLIVAEAEYRVTAEGRKYISDFPQGKP
jgi:hypothetical protein